MCEWLLRELLLSTCLLQARQWSRWSMQVWPLFRALLLTLRAWLVASQLLRTWLLWCALLRA